MDAPIHYAPNCLIKDCEKCMAEALRFANLPTQMSETLQDCGCTFTTEMNGTWFLSAKGPNCTNNIHVT